MVDLGTLVPSVSIDPESLMALIAVLGTTISPYLFFWETPQEVEDAMPGEIALSVTVDIQPPN